MIPAARPPKANADEHLIRREHGNPNEFSIFFQRLKTYKGIDVEKYIHSQDIPLGPHEFELLPGRFVILPHGYYEVSAGNGAPLFQMVTNYADSMGHGNFKASAPVVSVRK